MGLSSGNTADMLFQRIDECLASQKISWENYVTFSVDNTNLNLGKNNSILTRVEQQNPSVYFKVYRCHVVHNTSSAAAKAFNAETGFYVEDLLVDIYHWFVYSTKRKCKLPQDHQTSQHQMAWPKEDDHAKIQKMISLLDFRGSRLPSATP